MRGTRLGLVLGFLSLFSVLACGGGGSTSPGEVGAVRVTAAISAPDFQGTVRVTVSAPDIADIVSELAVAGNVFTGTVANIPAGTGRNVLVEALDLQGVVQYRGSATVNVTAGGTTAITIVAQQVSPPPVFGNTPPFIQSVVASAATVFPGNPVNVTVTAVDPDDALTYQWSPAGEFLNASAASTTWTAPATLGVHRLTITVTDARGLVASSFVDVTVAAALGTVVPTVTLNDWPVVTGMTVSPTRVTAGQPTAASAVASDVDTADLLTYAWTASCAGSFGSAAEATTTFTPATTVSGLCTLSVVVGDGRGGSGSGTIGLWVDAAP